jgi:hypothetical protein
MRGFIDAVVKVIDCVMSVFVVACSNTATTCYRVVNKKLYCCVWWALVVFIKSYFGLMFIK